MQVDVLSEIRQIAPTLHRAGTFSDLTLEAIFRHVSRRRVARSAETGSGASTLLLSHVSGDHTVFALDAGTGSVRSIEGSPLLRREIVTFVEGPTQLTLPRHQFTHPLQLVLLDGPHGYPFPDLEYYYLYPHLAADGLLIVDDIHIPTITNLFDFLSADEMFDLLEVVETTAFFRRTDAPTFSPIGDGWWTQRYNQRAFESTPGELRRTDLPEKVETPTPFHVDRFGPVTNPLQVAGIGVSRDEELVVAGWALDALRRRPAAAVDFVFDGATYRTAVRIPRADVASTFGDQAYFRSGFSVKFQPGFLTRGSHELEIHVVLSDQLHYYCGARMQFEAT